MSDTRSGSMPSPAPTATTARDWATIGLAGLIGARYCLPAESADQGETLWIVVLTLLFAAVQWWARWRNEEGGRPLDRIDAAALLLAGAPILSSLVVLGGTGNKRAALNLAWEWGATFLIWYEGRACFARGHGGTLLRSILALAIALSGYGIWQNQVWFKANADIVQELEQLEAQPTLTADEATRLRTIQQSLGPTFQSAQGGSRLSLLNRIRSSTEPIGCFALANTLASVLLAGLWLMVGTGISGQHDPTRRAENWQPGLVQIWLPRIGIVGLYLLLGVCLVMTKCRSAWLGAMASAALIGFVVRTGGKTRTGVIAMLTVAAAGAALLIVALLGGLIDVEVISEASKSLSYRLEYWMSTALMIGQKPWLGVGPGNFRAHYLEHKLPGASEEILDPHNLLLDVWANGGILAWSALVALIIWGIRGGWKRTISATEPSANEAPLPLIRWSESVWAAALGPALVFTQQLALGMVWDQRALGMAVVAAFLGGWLAVLAQRPRPAALWGAWLGLTVHLFAAGGIAMPVISQLWLLLLAGIVTVPSVARNHGDALRHLSLGLSPVLAGGALVLAIVCLRTAVLPNAICQAQMSLASEAIYEANDLRRGERHLIAAAEADPLQPLPWIQLLQIRIAAATRSGEDRDVDAAAETGNEAIARQTQNPLPYELMGDLYFHSGEGVDSRTQQAVGWYEKAVQRYPNSANLRTKQALALARAGQTSAAQREAQRAAELDDLNHHAGHVDKVLDEATRQKIDTLTGTTP